MSSPTAKEPQDSKAPKKEASPKSLWFLGKIPPIYLKIAGSVAVLVLILMLLIKACSGSPEKAKGYVIGRDNSWYPLQLFNKEKNMTAFTDNMIAEIAKDEDLLIRIVESGTTRLFPDLESGLYDGVFSVLSPTSAFHEKYLFTDSFYLIGPVLVVPEKSKITSIKDMEGKIVGVRSGVGGAVVILPENKYPSVMMTTYTTVGAAIGDLENDKIDGIVIDALQAYGYTQGLYAGKLKVVTAPLTDEGVRIVMMNEERNKNFIDKFNAGLKKLRENGAYAKLINDWGLINTEALPSLRGPKASPETEPEKKPSGE